MTNFWEDKRILVTGSGGFVGTHLVNKLLELKCNVFTAALLNNNAIYELY